MQVNYQQTKRSNRTLGNMNRGDLFRYDGHIYQKVDLACADINLDLNDLISCVNVKHGSTRCLPTLQRVEQLDGELNCWPRS